MSYQIEDRYAMRWDFSVSPASPAKDILLPEMYLPGFVMYIHKCLSDQTIPEPFMALL